VAHSKSRAALYTSKHDNWATPRGVLEAIRRTFGAIALDPCAARHSKLQARARYFTGGLDRPWPALGLVYVNPPYGKTMRAWADHCVAYAAAGGEVLLLVPARTDTVWWDRLTAPDAAAVAFVRGRLRFELPGATECAPFPSALVYLGHRSDRFEQLAKRVRASVWTRAPATLRASRGKSRPAIRRAA
jgi:phage N-6-adenine-methyltransferase